LTQHTDTRFALVEVLPQVAMGDADVEIKAGDLKMDVFRSSGAGGQNVQKNATAVRLTHIPTGIVVTCQNERSQLQNRENALRVLRARLLELKHAEQEQEIAILRGEYTKAEWGSQIRSYVLHPYQMVKDHRTEFGTTRGAVPDGGLDGFMGQRANSGGEGLRWRWLRQVFTWENSLAKLLLPIVILIFAVDMSPTWIWVSEVTILQITVLIGLAAIVGRLRRGRQLALLAASGTAIFWLQPAEPITNLGFWIPVATLGVTVTAWALTSLPAARAWSQTWPAMAVLSAVVVGVAAGRSLGLPWTSAPAPR
jgi:hypothetical protein